MLLLITPGEKRETSTKTCNETMLRDKLRVLVSRISLQQDMLNVCKNGTSVSLLLDSDHAFSGVQCLLPLPQGNMENKICSSLASRIFDVILAGAIFVAPISLITIRCSEKVTNTN